MSLQPTPRFINGVVFQLMRLTQVLDGMIDCKAIDGYCSILFCTEDVVHGHVIVLPSSQEALCLQSMNNAAYLNAPSELVTPWMVYRVRIMELRPDTCSSYAIPIY